MQRMQRDFSLPLTILAISALSANANGVFATAKSNGGNQLLSRNLSEETSRRHRLFKDGKQQQSSSDDNGNDHNDQIGSKDDGQHFSSTQNHDEMGKYVLQVKKVLEERVSPQGNEQYEVESEGTVGNEVLSKSLHDSDYAGGRYSNGNRMNDPDCEEQPTNPPNLRRNLHNKSHKSQKQSKSHKSKKPSIHESQPHDVKSSKSEKMLNTAKAPKTATKLATTSESGKALKIAKGAKTSKGSKSLTKCISKPSKGLTMPDATWSEPTITTTRPTKKPAAFTPNPAPTLKPIDTPGPTTRPVEGSTPEPTNFGSNPELTSRPSSPASPTTRPTMLVSTPEPTPLQTASASPKTSIPEPTTSASPTNSIPEPTTQPPTSMITSLTPSSFPQGTSSPEPSIGLSSLPPSINAVTSSCVPLDPNPDSFEDGSFPLPPWSTGGDGDWALSTERAYDGTASLRSPVLDGSQLISNATLQICDDFTGGILRLQAFAPVMPPKDLFVIYVDGELENQLVNVNEWTNITLELAPGPHAVDFSYQYNIYGIGGFPQDTTDGAVWIDAVELDILAQTT